MGLDITAYSKLVYLDPQPATEEEKALAYESDVLYVEATEGMDRIAPQTEGLYEVHGESMSFAAGSYGGYNYWRNQLSQYALGATAGDVWLKAGDYAGKPFIELINFSDCEGWIGAAASAKLAADFAQNRELIHALDHSEYPRFMEQYDNWHRAFVLAADNGVVQFR